jgi:hypothetical protein
MRSADGPGGLAGVDAGLETADDGRMFLMARGDGLDVNVPQGY